MIDYDNLSKNELEQRINVLLVMLPLSLYSAELFHQLTMLVSLFYIKFVNNKIHSIVCYNSYTSNSFLIQVKSQISLKHEQIASYMFEDYGEFCQQIFSFMVVNDATIS